MSLAGSKVLPFPISRRSEQTGLTQRSFPARWLALLLMGSMGAAWALSPTDQEQQGLVPALAPTSKLVIEGEPQVISQLIGSVIGEVALSSEDRALLEKGPASRRIVMESQPAPGSLAQSQREKAEFMRVVEDLEAEYTVGGRYPALPSTSGSVPAVSYRTDGSDFTLSSGNRRYTANDGMTYGAPPATGLGFEVKGFLSSKTSGWGPWQQDNVALTAKPGVESVESLAFLEALPEGARWSARMFFPVDQETCGYLFRRPDGKTAYTSGELTYDGVSGNFSLKLFRGAAVPTHALNSAALEAELKNYDTATALVGEAALLADLGLMAKPAEGEEVVALSNTAALPCTVSSALDGLRLATLDRHKQVLTTGRFSAGEDSEARATVVGSVQMLDKVGQVHQLRLRGGRGANYDWLVGQVCPLSENVDRPAGFLDSQAPSYEESSRTAQATVRAGR